MPPPQKPTPPRPRSPEIPARAEKLLVGGVNSPVRAFRHVQTDPLIIDRGEAQHLYDADGNRYLDFVCSWGALLLGHANPQVTQAIATQAARGTSFGVTTELELELATLINRAIPALEKIRFVSSGTEATMSAVRLARGVTKRDYILKFRGNYHGPPDIFLSDAGPGLATLSIAECPGVPEVLAQLTLNAPYNNIDATARIFNEHKNKIAAVIVEPIAANMGVVLPEQGFLADLRELTRMHHSLLIVDEVITGFRLHNGAVQQYFNIDADLTTLGKIIGGGLPVAAYGGRADLMNHIAPLGPVYQAGTLAGNPLAMAAGIATLKQLNVEGLYHRIAEQGDRLASGLRKALADANIPGQVNNSGSLSTLFFSDQPVRDYASAKRSNTTRYARFFREMLDGDIFLAPSQFETAFVSAVHTPADIDYTLSVASDSLKSIAADA